MAVTPTTVHAIQHIVSTPGICGGKPRIANHRIKVQHVAVWHKDVGMTPEQIAEEYELTLAEVHAALAYYYDHREEIDRQIREDNEFVERMMKEQGPDPLRRRIERLGLSMAQAHALVEYYREHREEVDREMAAAGLEKSPTMLLEGLMKIGVLEKIDSSQGHSEKGNS